jgi:MFS family permease
MAALVFAKLYFPSSDPLTGTLQSFAVFAVGFAARPIGAAIFGHYGDRIGRKAALIATLLLTGLSTFLVGCVPTYEQIGIWGAVVLVALRFIQGIGLGGEWGGSVLLSMEWARTSKNHGVIAAWPLDRRQLLAHLPQAFLADWRDRRRATVAQRFPLGHQWVGVFIMPAL